MAVQLIGLFGLQTSYLPGGNSPTAAAVPLTILLASSANAIVKGCRSKLTAALYITTLNVVQFPVNLEIS